jgi:hypothetical protein
MPREFVIVSRRAPTTDDLREAASGAGLRATVARAHEGAVDMIVDEAGGVVLSVEYTQRIAVPDEVVRLAPAAAAAVPGPVFWTHGWAPFGERGERGERIAAELARLCDGVCMREDGTL